MYKVQVQVFNTGIRVQGEESVLIEDYCLGCTDNTTDEVYVGTTNEVYTDEAS